MERDFAEIVSAEIVSEDILSAEQPAEMHAEPLAEVQTVGNEELLLNQSQVIGQPLRVPEIRRW